MVSYLEWLIAVLGVARWGDFVSYCTFFWRFGLDMMGCIVIYTAAVACVVCGHCDMGNVFLGVGE